ncbi:zinc-ribbon domain containing protein [soil metagenome]
MYTDQVISCADCGEAFTFTSADQEFYAEKGFSSPPKRCRNCRQTRKQQRNASGSDWSSSGASGGYGGGGGGGGGGYDRRPREMFDAVCANCGQATQVPFQPTGARPVYCNDCFRARR